MPKATGRSGRIGVNKLLQRWWKLWKTRTTIISNRSILRLQFLTPNTWIHLVMAAKGSMPRREVWLVITISLPDSNKPQWQHGFTSLGLLKLWTFDGRSLWGFRTLSLRSFNDFHANKTCKNSYKISIAPKERVRLPDESWASTRHPMIARLVDKSGNPLGTLLASLLRSQFTSVLSLKLFHIFRCCRFGLLRSHSNATLLWSRTWVTVFLYWDSSSIRCGCVAPQKLVRRFNRSQHVLCRHESIACFSYLSDREGTRKQR